MSRTEVQPPRGGVLPLLLLAPDAGVQPPGGRQLLRPLPLLRQLHPRPRRRAAAALAGGRGRLLHLHAGGVRCENLQKLPANVIYTSRFSIGNSRDTAVERRQQSG